MAPQIICWTAIGVALAGAVAGGCVTTAALTPAVAATPKAAESPRNAVPIARVVPISETGSAASPELATRVDDAGGSAKPQPEYPERTASEALDRLRAAYTLRRERRGTVITLPTDGFMQPGQWALASSDRFWLREIARALDDQYGRTIVVQVYTDSDGTAMANDALSLRRAESIRDYFVTSGVPSDAITALGLGGRRPVAGNGTPDGRAQNRRVEIVIAVAKPKASL
jgi:outer membrane protein OmpA-like peptidoglycan-associated protein